MSRLFLRLRSHPHPLQRSALSPRLFITHHHHHQQKPAFMSTATTSTASGMDYQSIPTPAACYADFCLIPVGTGTISVAAEVAEVQRVLKASGLKYTMHSAGTTVEGSWQDVMTVVGKAHTIVHQRGVLRVQSSMRVGSRTDKKQTAEEKVKRIEDILAQDST